VKKFELIWMTICELFKQIWHLPQTFMNVFRQRRQQAVRKELEVERLDRIRNPSKYRGR